MEKDQKGLETPTGTRKKNELLKRSFPEGA